MARANRTPKPRRNWKPAWLEAFQREGTVSAACLAARVGRTTVYEARDDEAFAQAWDDIEAETTDRMEREAFRRAVEGHESDIFFRDQVIGTERKYSDTLLIFMLKARKPQVYRENVRVEHSGPGGGPIEQVVVPSDARRAQEVAAILADVGAVPADGKVANGNGNGSHTNGRH